MDQKIEVVVLCELENYWRMCLLLINMVAKLVLIISSTYEEKRASGSKIE